MTNPEKNAKLAGVAVCTRHLLVVDADVKTVDLVRTAAEAGAQVRHARRHSA